MFGSPKSESRVIIQDSNKWKKNTNGQDSAQHPERLAVKKADHCPRASMQRPERFDKAPCDVKFPSRETPGRCLSPLDRARASVTSESFSSHSSSSSSSQARRNG